jgi:hypothetical protein
VEIVRLQARRGSLLALLNAATAALLLTAATEADLRIITTIHLLHSEDKAG